MNTDSLIAELSLKLETARPVPLRRVMLEWFGVSLISLAMVVAMSGLRADFASQMQHAGFALEMALNVILMIAAAWATVMTAYPDRAHAPVPRILLAVSFIGYSALALLAIVSSPEWLDSLAMVETHSHGIECLMCILAGATMPALWLFWRVRRLASVVPSLSGALAVLTAIATGCLGVRLVEHDDGSAGHLLWHYLPLILFSLAGFALGKKVFRWSVTQRR